jgi:signal transduction histidine kinase
MATFVERRSGEQPQRPARAYPSVPWSPRAWSQVLYLLGGVPAQVIPALLAFWVLIARHFPPSSGDFTADLLSTLLVLAAAFLALPLLTSLHRYRLRVTAGVDIPPPPAIPNRLSRAGIAATARSQSTWRQIVYHLLAAPALAGLAIASFGMWLAGVIFTFIYPLARLTPQGSTYQRGLHPVAGEHLPSLHGIPLDASLTVVGVALLLLAPRVTAFVTSLDARTARSLLGPSQAEQVQQLEHKVEHLTQTRAGVVDAADAERRRLERDLHDGTQQRLVSLAMNLGMARARATTVEEAQHAIAEAHEEAKSALVELRNLVRGLHPAVLEDRGLDAALSGIAARLPIPVRLTVDVDPRRRPSPAIEAVAYFVVSEGLTNITKHAQASQAEVFVQRAGNRLHIIVTDDGVGGAGLARGTGLAGLAKRAESVDGTFEISSPEGGPTMLTVDLPCVR